MLDFFRNMHLPLAKFKVLLLILVFMVALSGGAVLLCRSGEGTGTPSQKPAEEFKREGVVFSNTKLHNLEVIRLKDGSYRMFFHEGGQIKSAMSNDGRQFVLEEGVRLEGSMPAFVKLADGRWRLYYVVGAGKVTVIKSAVTTDGDTFKKETGVRLNAGSEEALDRGGPIHPSVIRLPDGSFKMFYDGVSSTDPAQSGPGAWTIMSATSEDGLIWQKDEGARIPVEKLNSPNSADEEAGDDDPVDDDAAADDDDNDNDNDDDDTALDVICDLFGGDSGGGGEEEDLIIDGGWSSHAEYDNGVYVLYFSGSARPFGWGGIWRATSADGLNFQIGEGPVLGMDPQYNNELIPTESGGPKGVPQDPFILHTSEGDRLFYWTPDGGILSAFRGK